MGLSALGAVYVFGVAVVFLQGCDVKRNKGTISASAFAAAQIAPNGVRSLSNKLDLLRTIFPSRRDSELQTDQASAMPVAKVDDDVLLLFEQHSGAVCSVDYCAGCPRGVRARVRTHFTRIGLEEELTDTGAVQPAIVGGGGAPPIRLSNGWVLAYERQSLSLIAFRLEENFRPAPADEDHLNFGRGNGLLLSIVLSGVDLQRELQLPSIPFITRMVELRDGRVLLFFREIFREIHVLHLSEVMEQVDFDRSDVPDTTTRTTRMLRGSLLPPGASRERAPLPFLTFDDILDVTQGTAVDVDSFQPIRVPSDGSILAYDRVRSMFLRISENRATGFGVVVAATPLNAVANVLLTPAVQFDMTHSWYHPSRSEILILEESTNSILGFNYATANINNNLRVVVGSVALVSGRRDPSGGGGVQVVPGGAADPVLNAAANDLPGTGQRLFFDTAREELIAASYSNGVVVISGTKTKFTSVTGGTRVDLTYLEVVGAAPGGGHSVRVWDTASTSLLELVVTLVILPDVQS
jgi:hypothetical protein